MLKQKSQKLKVETEQREQSSMERIELATDELGSVKSYQRSIRQQIGKVKNNTKKITYSLKR